jgi:predicted ATP-grasp superfamily ATP-dependent carboligase
MTRLLLFEFFVAGGRIAGETTPESLRAEGRAMLTALADDFQNAAGCEVRIAMSEAEIIASSANFDWTLIIAPEIDGHLLRLAAVPQSRLLGGSLSAIHIASDKSLTADYLHAHGVLGTSTDIRSGEPCVCKPRNGAGSLKINTPVPFDYGIDCGVATGFRRERFCPGSAASCAVLCGPKGHYALRPCWQHLAEDGTFTYLGGEIIADSSLTKRAQNLALAAIKTLPQPHGYFGVDLVLGENAHGSEDVVIEINPRLTTSYIGLRAATDDNLAAAMLAVAAGKVPRLTCPWRPVRFFPDGRVETLEYKRVN